MPGRLPKHSLRSPRGLGSRGGRGRAGQPRVFLPQGHEPGYAYPLLVWLNEGPRFDLGRAMARTSLRNFVAVQPAGRTTPPAVDERPGHASSSILGRSSDDDRDERIWRAIDAVRSRVSIHPRRVFLVGHGRGGTRAFRVACRHPREFAGVASFGGPFPLDEGAFAGMRDVRRLPMLLCCRRDAEDMEAVRIDRTLRLFHAAGAVLAVRIYPGRRDLTRTALADLNRWIMDEICGSQPCHA
jgi:pimeloyl-ACP methyl ester carboxylesterase